MRFTSLQDWLNWLESCHPSSEIELGLERISQVASRLNIAPSLNEKTVVTVAGTNGKGSCVAALNTLLRSAGFHVACYTSPHLINYNERIVIDDEPVDESRLVESFERVDQARESIDLTYFEFGTLVALDIFQCSTVDVAILEIGLGGRLDAVNIIEPDIAIVTSIDLDHQDWLGSNRESIAKEKAGIFRKAKPALCADPDPPQMIQTLANELGAILFQRGGMFDIKPLSGHSRRYRWTGVSAEGDQLDIDLAQLTLPDGSVAAALQALQLLDVSLTKVDYRCLESVELPGRFQYKDQGQVILDVAHNPAAARYLAKKLQANPINGKTFALLAMMKDKDCESVVDALKANIDTWFVADLNEVPRAMPAQELATLISDQQRHKISVNNTVQQAYQRARLVMGAEDRLIVFGSFITVSEIMRILLCENTAT